MKRILTLMVVFSFLSIEEYIILNANKLFPAVGPSFVVSMALSITLLLGIFIGLWEMAHDRRR